MSRKYIKQEILENFIYPNNEKDQYDIEIVHDINNNCVSGDINTFSATTTNQTGITIQYSFDWDTNGAELFQMDNGNYSYISVHMMAPTQTYFKPFRVAFNIESSTLYTGTTTFTGTTTVLPDNIGEDLFSNGTYYYEVRFIGHRCIYPVCGSFTVSGITPGPTPTPTATPTPTTTSTPTPTSTPTATPTATPTEDLNINAKYINNEAILQYDVNGGSTQTLGNIDSLTCQYFFTITGLTNGDILQFYTQGTNAINGSTTDCPNTTFCLTLSYTFTGTTTIYITVDGSVSC